MAWTQEQLDALEEAMASGTLTVKYSSPGGNKEVTYRSLDEMMKVRDLMRASLGITDGRNTRILSEHDRGF